MYVRINYLNNIYYSYVFAYFEFDYMPRYVVFNPTNNKFEVVKLFSKSCDGVRQVGFMNEHEKDFIYKDELEINMGKVVNCGGYPWLIENIELLKDIELGKDVNEEYKKIAKELNATIDVDAWNEVTDKESAEDMMNHVGGFHDWYLISIHGESDPYDIEKEPKLQIRFTSQCAFDVILEFDNPYINYGIACANLIYLSCIVIHDNKIYWVDGEECIEIEDINRYNYIMGNKLRWKFVLRQENDW